jgi:hypothetical protein
MDYHPHNRSGDGVLRMLAYGYAFKEIEEKWPVFKDEPRDGSSLLQFLKIGL